MRVHLRHGPAPAALPPSASRESLEEAAVYGAGAGVMDVLRRE